MTEVPLIEREVDSSLGPASSYVAPKVALPVPKNIPSIETLPTNTTERERMLGRITALLLFVTIILLFNYFNCYFLILVFQKIGLLS
jgi:hypothetical protein